MLSGAIVGTVTDNSDGTLALRFGVSGVFVREAQVNEVMRSIAYANLSDTPPASVTIEWTFSDFNRDGIQGSGGALTASGTTTVTIIPGNGDVNNAPVAVADTLAATEDTPVTYTAAQLLGNDTDVDAPSADDCLGDQRRPAAPPCSTATAR